MMTKTNVTPRAYTHDAAAVAYGVMPSTIADAFKRAEEAGATIETIGHLAPFVDASLVATYRIPGGPAKPRSGSVSKSILMSACEQFGVTAAAVELAQQFAEEAGVHVHSPREFEPYIGRALDKMYGIH